MRYQPRYQPDHEVLLGQARGRAVMYWPDYGVVCPDLVTTNGSLVTLMNSWGRPDSLTPEGVAFFIGRAFYACRRESR